MKPTEIGKTYELQPDPTVQESVLRAGGGVDLKQAERELKVGTWNRPDTDKRGHKLPEKKRVAKAKEKLENSGEEPANVREGTVGDKYAVMVGYQSWFESLWMSRLKREAMAMAVEMAKARGGVVIDSNGKIIHNFTGKDIIEAQFERDDGGAGTRQGNEQNSAKAPVAKSDGESLLSKLPHKQGWSKMMEKLPKKR